MDQVLRDPNREAELINFLDGDCFEPDDEELLNADYTNMMSSSDVSAKENPSGK